MVSAAALAGQRVGDLVEGAAAGEALDLAAVEQPRIDPRGEIVEAAKRTVRRALLDQLLHRLLADALERAERVADGMALAVRLDRELGLAGVDRRAAGRHGPCRRMSSTKMASLSVWCMSKHIEAA